MFENRLDALIGKTHCAAFSRYKQKLCFECGLGRKRLVNTCYYIKEISAKTGVKAGTIRFYEKLGFLEPVARMSNQYRVFNEHHIYQIQVCSLIFGGFVNTRLRKISMNIIAAAKDWDLEAYDRAAQNYLQAVEQDITRTKKLYPL